MMRWRSAQALVGDVLASAMMSLWRASVYIVILYVIYLLLLWSPYVCLWITSRFSCFLTSEKKLILSSKKEVDLLSCPGGILVLNIIHHFCGHFGLVLCSNVDQILFTCFAVVLFWR
jgi:hypothetical protein